MYRFKIVTIVIVFSLLCGILPHAAFAQSAVNTTSDATVQLESSTSVLVSEDWYNKEISRTRTLLQQGLQQVSAAGMSDENIAFQPDSNPPHGIYQNGCTLVWMMDEERDLSSGSENITVVEDGTAYRGVVYYRGSNIGYQRLVAYQRYNFESDKVLIWSAHVRSDTPGTGLNAGFFDSSGNVIAGRPYTLKGDGSWEKFGGILDESTPNVVLATTQSSSIMDFDALTIYSCDPSSTHMPFIGFNAETNLPSCFEGWVTERKAGRSKAEIEVQYFLPIGSVRDADSANLYACWDKNQDVALNHFTGELVTFVRHNREIAADEWLASAIMPVGTVVPFWAEEVVGTSSRSVSRFGARILGSVSPWALVLGIFVVGGLYYGWQAYLNASNPQIFNPPITNTYEGNGRSITFVDQRFRAKGDLFGADAPALWMYRLEDLLTADQKEYISDVDPRQIYGFSTNNPTGEPITGFLYSSQDMPNYRYLTDKYRYEVLERTGEIIGQAERRVGDEEIWETHPEGPLTPEQGQEIADQWEREIRYPGDPIILRPAEEGVCIQDIYARQISRDALKYIPELPIQVTLTMANLVTTDLDYFVTRFTHSQFDRVGGTRGAVDYLDFVFPDGFTYYLKYVCLSSQGMTTWGFVGYGVGSPSLEAYRFTHLQ